MKIWLKFVIAHPLITLSLLALTTAALAPGVLKLTFNNRLEAFMPKGDIDYIENEKTKEIYGDNSRYFVISVPKKGDEATFFSEFETLIQDLEAFQTFPGPYLKTDLTRLKALIQKRSLHIKELETHFASSPLFLRLVKRELHTQKGDKTRFTAKEIQKTVQEVEKKIALMAQEPLKRIVSPFTVSDIRASGDEIFTGPILSQNEREERILPKGPFERQRFLNRLSANPSFESGIYATNGKGEITDFGVIVTFTPTTRVDEISRAVIDICLDRPLLSVLPQGSPVINVWFNTYMQTDLKRFLPLVILVMALTFLLNFRSPEGLFLPLTALITSTVWIMGFMGHFGFAITPLGISLPSLMVSVGSSYAIHIYNQYLSERATFQQATFSQDLLSATKHIAPTVLFASLTTIIAFATLASSKLSAVREWGLLSALGVLFSMVVATSLIPSVLVLRHQKKRYFPFKKIKKTGSHPVDLVIRSLIHLATQHPRRVVAATLTLLLFCMAGVFRIQVESDFLTYFKRSDYVRTSAQVVDDKFKGRWGFNLLLNSGAAGGALAPPFLKEIERIRGELSSEERKAWSIGRTDAITDFLKIMNRATNQDDPSYYKVPDNPLDVVDYFEIYGGDDENDDGRPDDFEPLFDKKREVANIICRFTEAGDRPVGSTRMGLIMDELETWVNQTLPKGASAKITGFPKIDVKITRFITWGQISSLGLSLGVIFLIVLIRFRSCHAALLALVPMGVAVIINFGVMGWCGINLDMLTSIIASITIGIGVDDTIHFLNTYRDRTRLENLSMEEAVEKTLSISGRAITYTSLALIAGFLVLISSNFTAVILFGSLMTLTMVATTLGALLVLPSLVLITEFNPAGNTPKTQGQNKTQALIELLRSLGRTNPVKENASHHLKEQTEEEYQAEQKAWLDEVRKRKKEKGESRG